MADRGRAAAAPARLVRRRARPVGARGVLGALLRRVGRPDRAGLLRAGRAADRRARPAAPAPGRLLRVAAGAVLGRAVRAHRSHRLDRLRARPLARHRRPGARPGGAEAGAPARLAGARARRSRASRSRCSTAGTRSAPASACGSRSASAATAAPRERARDAAARARRRARAARASSFDPATRTLRFTLRTARFGGAEIRARVARSARIGTPLEVIGYVTGPDDPMPLDDRGVDRAVVARRAVRTFPRARSSRCAHMARLLRAAVRLYFLKRWRSDWRTGRAAAATATSSRRSATRRWSSSSGSRRSPACGSGPSSSPTTRPARSRTASRAR